jgi:DNA-binding transcriptional ArsR family regulator
VDGSLDPRAAAAYSHLEQLALMARTRCTRLDVEVLNAEGAVEALRETIIKLAEEGVPVVVDVGGGMRLLVLEALLAILSLPSWLRDVVKVIAYLEGTTRYAELDYGKISRIVRTLRLQGREEELTYVDRKVLEILEKKGATPLQQIYEELIRQGIATSKQNVNRILNKLRNKGYVKKIGRGVYVKTLP